MKKVFTLTLCCWAVLVALHAQSPTDGLMMKRRQFCTLLQYSNSSWEEYWEGPTKRSNSNLGTFTAQNVMLMSNYGITDRLNIMAALPYVWTTSDSYLRGQRGLQDLSLWLKYQLWSRKWSGGSEFKLHLTGGASTPVSNYAPDFLPLSIGLHSPTASLRSVINFTHRTGIYATAQAGHTWRSNINSDRDSYLFNNELIYSDEMPVPNVFDATMRLGYIRHRIQAELWYDYFTGLSGDDIRYNEMPQPTVNMQAASAGLYAKYFLVADRFAIQASAGQVLSGRNVGKGLTYTGGLSYLFALKSTPRQAAK